MKAILHQKSAPGKLIYAEVEQPTPASGQVLIKVHASSVNTADYRMLKLGIVPKRKIYGGDIAGTVVALGPDVLDWKIDDAVVGELSDLGFGGWAEYVCAPQGTLVRKPQELSFEEVAALPLAGTTALQALRHKGMLEPGQQVLVVGSSGGVQAHQLGAQIVLDYTTQTLDGHGESQKVGHSGRERNHSPRARKSGSPGSSAGGRTRYIQRPRTGKGGGKARKFNVRILRAALTMTKYPSSIGFACRNHCLHPHCRLTTLQREPIIWQQLLSALPRSMRALFI